MFYLIRIILFVFIGGILLILFRKKWTQLVRGEKVVHLLFGMYLLFFSCKIPFDFFIPFETAEEAFYYVHYREQIEQKFETEECAVILFDEHFSDYYSTYVNKANGKWFYPSPFAHFEFHSDYMKTDDRYVYIYRYEIKEHKKQLILILAEREDHDLNDNRIEMPRPRIEDNVGSEFVFLPYQEEYYYCYYAFVPLDAKNYELTIEGEKVDIQD